MTETPATQPATGQPDLYSDYAAWKGWSTPFTCNAELAGYYAAELRGRGLSGAEVLEIGFGNGEFLGWARDCGATIHGCEITTSSIEAAKSAGIPLLPADFEAHPALAQPQFDVIAAFDVFEHLDPPTIIAKLAACEKMLKPGGWLLLRFPNGQSPFGLGPQHGDATHVTALSRAKMEQYAASTAFRTLHYGPAARGPASSLAKRLVRSIRYALRDAHKRLIRFLYATDIELDPVVTHILAKPASA